MNITTKKLDASKIEIINSNVIVKDQNICKIRISNNINYTSGDMFAPRNAQKGTIGILNPDN